jgi:hypothetical protein
MWKDSTVAYLTAPQNYQDGIEETPEIPHLGCPVSFTTFEWGSSCMQGSANHRAKYVKHYYRYRV